MVSSTRIYPPLDDKFALFYKTAMHLVESLCHVEKALLFVVLTYTGLLDLEFSKTVEVIIQRLKGLGLCLITSQLILKTMCGLKGRGILVLRDPENSFIFGLFCDIKSNRNLCQNLAESCASGLGINASS